MKYGMIRSLLLLTVALAGFTSCDDDDNSWRDKNDEIFDQLGKTTVTLPRNKTIYGETVRDTMMYINVEPADVVTHSSGLKYRVMKKGEGTETIYFSSKVRVNYEGRRIDGSIFDTTMDIDSKGPLETYVRGSSADGLIRGWTEVLQVMKEGDVFEVYIPWDLGYGDKDNGSIEAYSTLIFIMELVGIVEQ